MECPTGCVAIFKIAYLEKFLYKKATRTASPAALRCQQICKKGAKIAESEKKGTTGGRTPKKEPVQGIPRGSCDSRSLGAFH